MAAPLVPFGTTYAPTALVASADHLATAAGVDVLRRGGSAADAVIATNAVIAVTAPHLCGMGGDLFALVHDGSGVTCLNASGRAGRGADPARLRSEGHRTMPFRHDPRAVTVPGCVDGWLALHARHGRLPLGEVLAAAAGYAADGFPASPLLVASLAQLEPPLAPAAAELRAQASRPGDVVRRPGVAGALAAVAAGGRDAFYGGAFGEGLLALGGGEYEPADLQRPLADWVEPLAVDAWGHRLWTVPPNSQGYLTLASAWIAAGLDLPADADDPAWAHLLVESALAAGHDRPAVLHEHADGDALVAPVRLEPRRAAIGPRAGTRAAPARDGDTTYLCAVDGDGMGVSLIQSNASGFGSWLFEPTTGINLHNRGIGFSVEAGHPAEYGPGRRPPHTLCPALVTRSDGRLAGVLGTQGGDAQPQVLLQVLARWLAGGASPGSAIGSPRWALTAQGRGFDTWTSAGGPAVAVEAHGPWHEGLAERGHRVVRGPSFDHGFGHAHLVTVDPRGVLAGAADPRARIGSCSGF